MTARILAFLIGVLGLASLRGQYDALLPPLNAAPLPQQLWALAGSFSILTALLTTAHLLAVARGWQMAAARAAGLLVSMAMVAVIHLAAAPLIWAPQDMGWRADQGLHRALPLALLLWWLAFAPKGVTRCDLPLWLIWPLLFAAYALIRGQVTGIWPYPFLNAATLGWPLVALNLTGLLAGFALTGLAVLALARWRSG